MIDFTDYTPTEDYTYTPFPIEWELELKWCMKHNGITDYKILTKQECSHIRHIERPDTVPVYYSRHDLNVRTSDYEYLVSHMPSEHIIKKLALIDCFAAPDPDMEKWKEKIHARIIKIHEEGFTDDDEFDWL